MKLHPSTLLVLLLITAGCGHSKDRAIATSLQDGLVRSNRMIADLIDLNFRALDDRLDNPLLHSRAVIWFPIIKQLKKTSNTCITYIDGLAAGKTKEGNKLAVRLSAFQKVLRSIDTAASFGISGQADDFSRIDDTLLKQMILSKIKNDVLTAEYKITKYCLKQISLEGWCIDYSPMMMLGNNRVRRGDTIRVTAWYGITVENIDLELVIKGNTIPQGSAEGIEYKFIANDPPGVYSLPVQLHYSKPDGTTAVVEKTFKYTILR